MHKGGGTELKKIWGEISRNLQNFGFHRISPGFLGIFETTIILSENTLSKPPTLTKNQIKPIVTSLELDF
jgi:hypothetical protein